MVGDQPNVPDHDFTRHKITPRGLMVLNLQKPGLGNDHGDDALGEDGQPELEDWGDICEEAAELLQHEDNLLDELIDDPEGPSLSTEKEKLPTVDSCDEELYPSLVLHLSDSDDDSIEIDTVTEEQERIVTEEQEMVATEKDQIADKEPKIVADKYGRPHVAIDRSGRGVFFFASNVHSPSTIAAHCNYIRL